MRLVLEPPEPPMLWKRPKYCWGTAKAPTTTTTAARIAHVKGMADARSLRCNAVHQYTNMGPKLEPHAHLARWPKEVGEAIGVEVRQRTVTLEGDSRLGREASDLPAVSWNHDFQQVSAQLYLPPGWRLFHASGPDAIQRSWVNAWGNSLLDLFLLLVVSLAIARLYGWVFGAVALVTLALVFPESDAPRWIWVPVLVVEGLLRALPAGRLTRAATAASLNTP